MTFRIEEKIPLSSSDMIVLCENLIKDGMKPLFKKRKIYSTYFETTTLNMFNDSLEGVLPRKKIRVRHYPDSSSNYSLEIKFSSIEGRFKKSNEISLSDHKRYLQNGIFHPYSLFWQVPSPIRFHNPYHQQQTNNRLKTL